MAAEANNFAQPCIPKFDGDYDHWSLLMENLLRSKEYWGAIEVGYVEPAEGETLVAAQKKILEEMKLKDLKAKNYLFSSIDKTILKTMTQKETAKQIWDSMKVKYQGNARVQRAQLQTLRRSFELLEMKVGETVTDYVGRVMVVANDMRNCGEDMPDVKIVEKILRTLTEKYNYIVCSIEESKDIDSLSVDALQSSLLVHEQKFKKNSGEEQALKVAYEESPGGMRGRGRAEGRGRGRGRQSYNKAVIECYKCHSLGHYQYECPLWNKKANYAEIDEEDEMLLIAYVEAKNSKAEEIWFLDSGCSNHMCGNKQRFAVLNEAYTHSVKLGDNSRIKVMGKGNIKLQMNGTNQVLTDVFYVPDLKNNLLSVGQLQERGLAILIQNGECRLYHPKRGLIMQTTMTANRMFLLSASVVRETPACLQTTAEDSLELWHKRFGHLSYTNLRTLQYKEMVKGLPCFKAETIICTECLVGKQHREVIPKRSQWRSSHKLQLVHADICGPITPTSNSGKRYILTFIDDFSRKVWVYFLLEKSEAFATFKAYKNLVEKESNALICCLRTDRGGEFTSNEFNEFCKVNGISRQLTASYTPQHNGIAERKNRTIMNMVRWLLYDKKVPKQFWPEATRWAAHVINRSPTHVIKDKTPEEMWSGVKPKVDYFRVFGCLAHVHVPDEKRKKLDDKSIQCVLLGVSKESKAYRLFDPVTKKIIVSRDVCFEEDKNWNWGTTVKEMKHDVLTWGDDDEDKETNSKGDKETEEDIEVEGTNSAVTTSVNDTSGKDSSAPAGVRNRRPAGYLQDYVSGDRLSEEEEVSQLAMFTSIEDPRSFEEAEKDAKWRHAMDLEIESIKKNGTWQLTTLPTGAKKIGVKWVFKTKLNEAGEVDKCKARLVAKGYTQQQGVDYNEVFAPVARWDTIRMVLALAAQKSWIVYQLDVKSAFLHGELSKDVYVDQPLGYIRRGEEEKVYKLKKALYGLKQAPRAWYSRIEAYFVKEGFERCQHEHTLFVKKEGGTKGGGIKILIVSLYVDDLIFTGNNTYMIEGLKTSMMNEFEMTDLGRMKYFLGVEVIQKSEGIYLSQRKYARELLERFGLQNGNPVKNPIVPGCKLSKEGEGVTVDATAYKQLIGSLLYITATRPDLMYVVCLLSRFMANPTVLHMQAAKRVLRYLKGTINLGVFYKRGGPEELLGYTDSDYARDADDSRSTSGYVFMLSNGAVSWASKKQPVVTLSTTEAEYVAAAACACQCVWMQAVLEKLGHTQGQCTTILCDNSSTIKLSKNPILHGRCKHIHVRFHFLRDLANNGVVNLVHCGSSNQIADILTKPLKLDTFLKLRSELGVCEVPGLN
ncbi:hypothetical protein LguiB_001366 [Lonicera macranthoides]